MQSSRLLLCIVGTEKHRSNDDDDCNKLIPYDLSVLDMASSESCVNIPNAWSKCQSNGCWETLKRRALKIVLCRRGR